GDHALGNRPAQQARQLGVDGAVRRDDPAEGGRRVGLARLAVGGGRYGGGRRVAGLGVLDDDRGRRLELARARVRGVEVEDVVVGQLLALEDLGARQAVWRRVGRGVERGRLVRVLAVAEARALRPL